MIFFLACGEDQRDRVLGGHFVNMPNETPNKCVLMAASEGPRGWQKAKEDLTELLTKISEVADREATEGM